jgi:thioredoxin reductase (NADPH)
MTKPALLVVDDDPAVLQSIARDVTAQFASQFRILRADSGPAALDLLARVKQRRETVALVLSDQRMPGLSGVELLERATALFPEAKRALLTAYADTEAAIRAINQSRIHYYFLKPWDPPEEKLYPVLQDLLDEWQASYRPPFTGIHVVGHRWSATSHQVKDFLARNAIPYRWLDLARDSEAKDLLALHQLADSATPHVILPDGQVLTQPDLTTLAAKTGLRTQAQRSFYDLVIVGGGPGGLAAAVYGASEGLRTVLVEAAAPGGQAGTSSRIENYLGFPAGLSGSDLARRAVMQAEKFGVELITQEAVGLTADGPSKVLRLANGAELASHTVVLAMGVSYNRLDAPGLERFTGAGVYYGAVLTEAISCRNEDVLIVGGGNSAGQGAVHLANYARSVTIVIRGESLAATMSQYLIDQIGATPNIRVRNFTEVAEADGQERLRCVRLRNKETGAEEALNVDAMFVFIGARPRTEWLGGAVARDAFGFIRTGRDLMPQGKRPPAWTLDRDPFLLETSLPGVFAAGDVRSQSVKRVASAVGEGSIAVQFVHQYLAQR